MGQKKWEGKGQSARRGGSEERKERKGGRGREKERREGACSGASISRSISLLQRREDVGDWQVARVPPRRRRRAFRRAVPPGGEQGFSVCAL